MMKFVIGLSALGLALSACATASTPMTYAAADTAFTGWVKFSNEEFQLYADEDQVLQPFARPCVSGAASRDEMRQAVQDLAGRKVTITGRTAAWSAGLPGNRIAHEGSVIRNDCGGAFVILADDIRPAN
ncbi:hypothetical protein [Brevundimonas basaltis]|uniref:Lipoprotein n=1 Tax=Brevundimonas basaltis TaxID=472166 RepID=A0A7W8HVP0_9CAUL|nr:hypothetical protein [Brevundimonas basaltis]MBB5290781.1 hypothetical protein [Brevundimonas basaltis]